MADTGTTSIDEVQRPFEQWLRDNDIPPGTIIFWPELEIDTEQGVIRIEEMVEPLTIVCDRTCTRMREYPLKKPMSEQLAAIWEHTAPHARAARRLGELLSLAAQHRATVVTAAPGDRMLLALAQPIDPGSQEFQQSAAGAQDMLRQLFPGIDIVLMFGVQAVAVDRPPGIGSQESAERT